MPPPQNQQNKQMFRVRSPKENPVSLHEQPSQVYSNLQYSQQANYLNHLKNRFKNGSEGGFSNVAEVKDSRNNALGQNNSSPV